MKMIKTRFAVLAFLGLLLLGGVAWGTGTLTLDAVTHVNTAFINGIAPLMGAGNTGTGSLRTTEATDSSISTSLALIDDDQTGSAPCYLPSAASTNATNCKASAGRLINGRIINTTSTIYYLRLYNLASAPTCSSATGFVATIPIGHASGNGGGVVFVNGAMGEAYGTGIGFCLTGGGSSTDNTNAATGVYITLDYK